MPITFPFFLFAKPAPQALRWIRLDLGPPSPDPGLAEARRRLCERLPPHLRRDLARDE